MNMKLLYKLHISFFLLFLCATSINAYEEKENVLINNIYYDLSYGYSSDGIYGMACLRSICKNMPQELNVPEEITYNKETYKVMKISNRAFSGSAFETVELPKNLIFIDNQSFESSNIKNLHIKGLLDDISVFHNSFICFGQLNSDCNIYVHGPNVTNVKQYFKGTNVSTYEKFWINNITEKTLSKASFNIPEYEEEWIGDAHFYRLKNGIVTKVSFNQQNLKAIDGLYTIDNLLPDSTYYIKFSWKQYENYAIVDEGVDTDSIRIYAPSMDIKPQDYYGSTWDNIGTYYLGNNNYSVSSSVTVAKAESLTEYGCYCKENKKYYKADDKGNITITGLLPNTILTLCPYGIYGSKKILGQTKIRIRTLGLAFKCDFSQTQTTITINSIKTFDKKNKEITPKEIGLKIDNNKYSYNGKKITIKDLKSNTEYKIILYASLEKGHYDEGRQTIRTEAVHPYITKKSITPTSINIYGSCDKGDAKIKKTYFEGYESLGSLLTLTGLKPEYTYLYTYVVDTEDGNTTKSTISISTPKLSFESLTPKIVTNNSTIICAKTNISDEEKGAGFEWRKTDAPDVVVSKSGSGVVYGGMLEGRINNLSTSSYYKVRPFYKASDGTMYYGEWIGFDPSDFSYFKPTVHTYARISVQSTSAKVKGVALQGTDDITEQGFEYWAENAIASRAAGDKQIIQATGQSMEAEITDLAPNTTYNYRAYAKTSKGTTYGETLKFTTPVATAIIGITNTTNSDLQFNVRNTNNVQIAINGTDKECNYRMNSITGANVASGKTTADGEWHSITNYQLPSGIYIITVSDGKDKKSTKIAIK